MQQVKGSRNRKLNRTLKTANHFIDKDLVKDYESWYKTIGCRSYRLEKELLKELLIPFSLLLPWGSFIGMSVRINGLKLGG